MRKIVIVTDCIDIAYTEMRATIIRELSDLGINEDIVDPVVRVFPFSIVNASFILRLLCELYPPKKTLFLVVVNALRTDNKFRARIFGETLNGFQFVCANTGAISWMVQDFGLRYIYEFGKRNLSGTEFVSFGGKYFHAPLAAKLASEIITPDKLGEKRDPSFLLDLPIEKGSVVHIDNFGVAKINLRLNRELLNRHFKIYKNGNILVKAKFVSSMKDCSDGDLVLLPGSSLNNLIELALVRKLDTSKMFDIQIGDIISLEEE